MKCRDYDSLPKDRIYHVEELPTWLEAVTYARASTRLQTAHGALESQINALDTYCATKNIEVAGEYKETHSGKSEDIETRDELKSASKFAKKIRGFVLAENLSRFIRSNDYDSKTDWRAQANEEDIQILLNFTDGALLATLQDPRSSPEEEKSFATIRGIVNRKRKIVDLSKNERGKYKIKKRDMFLEEAIEMHNSGFSYRKVSDVIGVPWRTIVDWIKWAEQL